MDRFDDDSDKPAPADELERNIQNGVLGEVLGRTTKAFATAQDGARELAKLRFQWRNVSVTSRAGYLGEGFHEATFKIKAAWKGRPDLSSVRTAAKGLPTAAADIEILKNGKPVASAQLKFNGNVSKTTFDISQAKYDGMQKVVAADQAEGVRRLAQLRGPSGIGQRNYIDTAQNVAGKITYEGVSSTPITHQDALDLARSRTGGGHRLLVQQGARTVLAGGGIAAALGTGVSVLKNGASVASGEQDLGTAATNVLSDGALSGLYGIAVSGIALGTQQAFTRLGLAALARSSAPAAIAVSAIEIGKDCIAATKGNITGSEFKGRAIMHTARGGGVWAGVEAGVLLGTAVFPGLGTIAGGILGGIAGSVASDAIISKARRILAPHVLDDKQLLAEVSFSPQGPALGQARSTNSLEIPEYK